MPCSSSRSWKNRPACSPKPRLSATGSSITSEHELPNSVSEAATSVAMYEPPISTTRLPAASARIASLFPSVRR